MLVSLRASVLLETHGDSIAVLPWISERQLGAIIPIRISERKAWI